MARRSKAARPPSRPPARPRPSKLSPAAERTQRLARELGVPLSRGGKRRTLEQLQAAIRYMMKKKN